TGGRLVSARRDHVGSVDRGGAERRRHAAERQTPRLRRAPLHHDTAGPIGPRAVAQVVRQVRRVALLDLDTESLEGRQQQPLLLPEPVVHQGHTGRSGRVFSRAHSPQSSSSSGASAKANGSSRTTSTSTPSSVTNSSPSRRLPGSQVTLPKSVATLSARMLSM